MSKRNCAKEFCLKLQQSAPAVVIWLCRRAFPDRLFLKIKKNNQYQPVRPYPRSCHVFIQKNHHHPAVARRPSGRLRKKAEFELRLAHFFPARTPRDKVRPAWAKQVADATGGGSRSPAFRRNPAQGTRCVRRRGERRGDLGLSCFAYTPPLPYWRPSSCPGHLHQFQSRQHDRLGRVKTLNPAEVQDTRS
jgi:hypothetical protein